MIFTQNLMDLDKNLKEIGKQLNNPVTLELVVVAEKWPKKPA